ncbi:MAG: PDZ domain-containing protein [Planctomycetaceae bacterium]|nr:PDZ domain-containing protein [Planctomycetaceae bacterium]
MFRLFCIHLLLLSFLATASPARCDDVVRERVAGILERMHHPEFNERRTAYGELILLRGPELQFLVAHIPHDSPEVAWMCVRALEHILQADAEQDGELAERTLEFLSFRENSVGAAAALALIRNGQLRESRATDALLKLGATINYINPLNSLASGGQPVVTAPGTGVGFGPAKIPTTIWIHSDWTGTTEDLWHIRRFAHRQRLLVYLVNGCGVSGNEVMSSAALWLPGLDVEQRGKANFGIIRETEFLPGCTIREAVEHGPAARAGLQQGDRIIEVDEKRIQSFYDLVNYLQNKVPRDVVEATFVREVFEDNMRREVTMKTKVTLGSWRTQTDPHSLLPPPRFQGPEGPSFYTLYDRPPEVPLPEMIQRSVYLR